MLRSDIGYISDSPPRILDFQSLIDAEELAVDIEGTGTHSIKDYPYGFSITASEHDAYYSDINNRFMLDIVANDNIRKIMYNGTYDRTKFKQAGVTINNIADPMIAAHLLELFQTGGNNLEDMSERVLGDDVWSMVRFSALAQDLRTMDVQQMAMFSGPHSLNTLLLWRNLAPRLIKNNLWNVFWKVEMPVLPVLSDMEYNGCEIDTEALTELGSYFEEKKTILKSGMDYRAEGLRVQGINWKSPDQVADFLYNKIHFPKPPSWTWKGKKHPSTDKKYLKETMEKMVKPPDVVKLLIMYKEYEHLQNTYVTGILKRMVKGRIHTNYNQARTSTGRLSSTDPNLQNIPARSTEGKKIRKSFKARKGCKLLKGDYEQMELRKIADSSKCWPMIDAFNNDRDIHTETAIRAFNDASRRADGKTKNFQLVYGGGSEEDKELMFKIYPQIKSWSDRQYDEFESIGTARSMFGRMMTIGEGGNLSEFRQEHKKQFEDLARSGMSLKIQGSCAEICKIGMTKVWKYIKDSDIKMVLQVHDEIVLEVPDDLVQDAADLMYDNMKYSDGLLLTMPIEVKVGDNWSEMTKIKHSSKQPATKAMVAV